MSAPDREPETHLSERPTVGSRIGGYRLQRQLGSGGTGDVWQAEDKGLGRRVAIKLPHPHLLTDERVRRDFLREARAGSMLDHPGIAPIYDVGDSPWGPYLVMASIEGTSLRDIMQRAPVEIAEAGAWVASAADALAHAHAHGVIHGDVSPGNLMLDGTGRLVVVDFGLARSLAPGLDTTRSQVRGTYPYMAPEVLRGLQPDLRSDLYGLGVVLYQLLTGELPYEGRASGAYVGAVLEGRMRDPLELNGSLPAAFGPLLLGFISLRAEDRPPSATEMARRVRAAVAGVLGSTSEVRAQWTAASPDASPEPERLHPSPVALPTAGAEADSATRTLVEARLLQAQALLRRPDQEASMDSAIHILETLRSLTPSDPRVLGALVRASLFKAQLARDPAWEDRAGDHLQRARVNAAEEPAVLLAAADMERIKGNHEEALALYARVLQGSPDSIDAHVGASWAHERRGELEQAESAARAAIAAEPGDWRGHSRLGGLLINGRRFVEAAESWNRVVEIAPDHARGWSSHGSVLFELEHFEDALEAFERSIRLQPTAIAFLNAGTALYYLGRHADAVGRYESAVALNPADARLWGTLATACRWINGKEARASEALDRAIPLMREHLERHPDDPVGWASLSHWLAQRGSLDEAARACERTFELAPARAANLPGIAGTLELLGDDAAAIRIYRDRVRNGGGLRVLEADPGLARLRSTPGWASVVEADRACRADPGGANSNPNGGRS